LRPTDAGLEWGSGRSTCWFAERVAKLVSVEHNAQWVKTIGKRLSDRSLAGKVDYRLIEVTGANKSIQEYVDVLQDFSDESLDFCLVDGQARDRCALGCLPKIRPGGIVIVDNIELYVPRDPKSPGPQARGPADGYASGIWEQFARTTADWRCIWTTNGVRDTALWVRPSS
jgi:predicted O-methyltransferase YrrM